MPIETWHIALGAVLLLVLFSLRIAQEYERAVIFRLGRMVGTRGPGLYLLIPWVGRARVVDIRTNTLTLEPQETITRDSVTIRVNAVLWYKVRDPELCIVAVADFKSAIYQAALTTLRNLIGQHPLDELLRERDRINHALRDQIESSATA